MKITEVKITGFKSFVDGVTLPISSGLTGVVGPNGCGKSNILEAIRWVMGATSAKALRGGEMDDVIFQGTENRPSRDIAEVIIKIDNSAGNAPIPFKNSPILEISRKIKRGQGSSFRINGKEARAKDIQLLFADASSGANSPALVRQGQVSELINARPENRRKVLEEAAGISGLQSRRHDAQNKLNGTETNLERIGEIIVHLEEQISSLKKQAIRAQKYRNLQAQIRGLEMYLSHQKYLGFKQNLQDVENNLKLAIEQSNDVFVEFSQFERLIAQLEEDQKPLIEEQSIAEAVLRRLEAKKFEFDRDLLEASKNLETAREAHSRIIKNLVREREIEDDAKNSLIELDIEISEIEKIENNANEIMEFENQIHNINIQIKSFEKANSDLITQKANHNAQFQANLKNRQQLKDQFSQIENNIKSKISQKLQLESALVEKNNQENLKSIINNIQKKLDDFLIKANSLETEINKFEKIEVETNIILQGLKNKKNSLNSELIGLEAITQTKITSKNKKAIDEIKVSHGYEKALSAALGDDLDAVIGLSELNHWNGAEIVKIDWPENIKHTPIIEFITAPIELKARLMAISLVDEDDFDKISKLPFGLRIVTKSGRLKRWDGFVITGSSALPTAIRLEQINRVQTIKDEIAKLNPDLKQKEEEFSNLKNKLLNTRDEIKKLRPNNNIYNRELFAAQQELANNQGELLHIQNAIENQIIQINNFEIQKIEVEKKLSSLGEIDNNNFQTEINILDGEIKKNNAELSALRLRLNEISAKLLHLKTSENSIIKKLENAKKSKENWQNRSLSASTRIKELQNELNEISKIIENEKLKPNEIEIARQKAIGELPNIIKRKQIADDNLANSQGKLRETILNARNKENQLNATKEAINTANILAQSWQERISELEVEILHNFAIPADELSRIYTPQLNDIIKNLNIEKAQSRLSRALEERNDIGSVNLRADIELEEQSKRHKTLSTERDDLMAAVKKLRIAINEINSEGKERLLKAFEIVNQHFVDLFTTLFEGGAAHLALTENEDPLGGGLEVYACPPGKRLSSMSLMSGGEQALTATALIFAVFLSNPSPISILDELDAPLDDANVDRFCRLLDEMRKRTETRFICITHHPITMARMDRLFGVTMAERGVSNVVSVDLSRAQSMIDAVKA